jgi:hypothetical protein
MYPDHPEANKLGCKCPVHYGNNKGEGTVVDGIRSFTVNRDCPIHADPRWWTRPPPAT